MYFLAGIIQPFANNSQRLSHFPGSYPKHHYYLKAYYLAFQSNISHASCCQLPLCGVALMADGLRLTWLGIAGSCYDCTSWNPDPSCAVISLLVPCLSLPPNANIGAPSTFRSTDAAPTVLLVSGMSEELVKQREVKLCLTSCCVLTPSPTRRCSLG